MLSSRPRRSKSWLMPGNPLDTVSTHNCVRSVGSRNFDILCIADLMLAAVTCWQPRGMCYLGTIYGRFLIGFVCILVNRDLDDPTALWYKARGPGAFCFRKVQYAVCQSRRDGFPIISYGALSPKRAEQVC